ncbi:MAG: hypothetical protein CM1200mP28_10170 [Deltaproteobacteria bacterium]|nr:MAG: hypothetical protein CM1200mP28_10170 [Deltaproteobacteria bacterium]
MMELKVKRVERVDGVKEAIFLPAIFNGLRLTVKHFWRNLFGARDVVTINYPEEKRPCFAALAGDVTVDPA